MDAIPDRLLISTSIEELRQQKVRLNEDLRLLSSSINRDSECCFVYSHFDGEWQPKKSCDPHSENLGLKLLFLDADYYFSLMNSTIRSKLGGEAGSDRDDEDIKTVAANSVWQCASNDRVLFTTYCAGGVTIDGCQGRSPSIPADFA
ncbi:hypothetical protein DHEL01_v201281 [Diaporthe helianthi]|uniref:Uncharacterized protein n=1 Tax=Diaporthe helianthi TaxID=158607 RepID=A0A2P5ICX4_DIAHE|nr:hypothetical protein DHEL01_v201281 [Diaporthe helianthi]